MSLELLVQLFRDLPSQVNFPHPKANDRMELRVEDRALNKNLVRKSKRFKNLIILPFDYPSQLWP